MQKITGFLIFCASIFSNILMAQVPIDSVAAIAKKTGIPGIQVVHAKKGETHSYNWGVLRMGADSAVNRETIFQAASLTKVIAAYAFFKLLDQGKMHLDTPLYRYHAYNRLATNPEGQTITARMVLTHRSGLLNWEGAVGSQSWRDSALHLQFKPGTDYMYSGEGFYFLQLAMEEAAGQSFQSLIEESVLKPMGMVHSQIFWKDTLIENIAFGHLARMQPRPLGKYRSVNAAYTLYTTAEDYTLFVQKALNKGIGLKPETHHLMISKAGEVRKDTKPTPEDAYVPAALGMRLQVNEAGTWLWHTGSNPGFRCFFMTNPESEESLAVFMNAESGFEAIPHLLKLFLGDHQTYWAYLWRLGELD
jgi:CubicO group peptidase (beta-lactamase class C family)